MNEDSFRYFTIDEVVTMIKEKRMNQYDIWEGYSKLSKYEQENFLKDKSIQSKVTAIINDSRTLKLLKNYYTIKNDGELIDYTVDLEDAFYKLTHKKIIELEESFSNAKERAGWILIQTILIGKPQQDIEYELGCTHFKISQRQISQVIRNTISKLTSLLIDK